MTLQPAVLKSLVSHFTVLEFYALKDYGATTAIAVSFTVAVNYPGIDTVPPIISSVDVVTNHLNTLVDVVFTLISTLVTPEAALARVFRNNTP